MIQPSKIMKIETKPLFNHLNYQIEYDADLHFNRLKTIMNFNHEKNNGDDLLII